jgi:hypothetical protein
MVTGVAMPTDTLARPDSAVKVSDLVEAEDLHTVVTTEVTYGSSDAKTAAIHQQSVCGTLRVEPTTYTRQHQATQAPCVSVVCPGDHGARLTASTSAGPVMTVTHRIVCPPNRGVRILRVAKLLAALSD